MVYGNIIDNVFKAMRFLYCTMKYASPPTWWNSSHKPIIKNSKSTLSDKSIKQKMNHKLNLSFCVINKQFRPSRETVCGIYTFAEFEQAR